LSILALDDRPSSFAYPLGTELPPTFIVSTDDLGYRLTAIEAAIRSLAHVVDHARDDLAIVAVHLLDLAATTVRRQHLALPLIRLTPDFSNIPDLADELDELAYVFGERQTSP